MSLQLTKPIVFFDLETTGLNILKDRIIEISLAKELPNGDCIVKTHKVNPTIKIPIESSLIHGIYDKDVEKKPSFGDLSKEIYQFIKDCDLAGFNIIKFDLPLLIEEFARANIEYDISAISLVDVQKIFHMMEKRTLKAAYKFYCNKDLDNAHSAEADTLATRSVFKAQMKKYQGQTITNNLSKSIGKLDNNIESIHKVTNHNLVDLAGRIVFNENGEEVFNFGKFKNKPVKEVLEKETGYYHWIMNGEFPQDTKKILTKIRLKTMQTR